MRIINPYYNGVSNSDLLANFFGTGSSPFQRLESFFEDLSPASRSKAQASADFFEDGENYYTQLELPGVKKEDLKIEFKDQCIELCVQSSSEDEEVAVSANQAFSICVPEDVSADRIHAEHTNGVLTVTLPKAEARKPLKIEVS